jgi:hypothetical protein
VLHSIAEEHLRVAVVHPYRNADDDGALGEAQPVEDAAVDFDHLGYGVELVVSHAEGGRVVEDGERSGVDCGVVVAVGLLVV